MSSRSQRPVGKVAATTMFYILALGSGLMRTLSVASDYVALRMHEIALGTVPNTIIYGFGAQWVSFAATASTIALLSIKKKQAGARRPLGYSLDPDFGGLRILPKKPMTYVVLAGIFAGISTTAYYYLISGASADALLPFGQLVIVYLLIGDLMAEKDTPTIIEVQCIISILFGVLLVGLKPGATGFDMPVLAIVLIPMNLSSAMTTYYQKKAKKYEIEPGLAVDALNMRIWSLLVLNTVFSVAALSMAPPEAWLTLADVTSLLLIPMVVGSLTAMLSIVMYVRALGRGSMAIVNSLSAISVVLGIPVTVIGSLLSPGSLVFGDLSGDTFVWILKTFGVILVVIGIVALEGSDVRTIMVLKVKSETGDLLPYLFAVKGVESASAIAGEHDYILSVKSRSLAKTRKQIVRKIEEIEGVERINTLVVLKEYR